MNPDPQPPPLAAYPCDKIVYRAALYPDWIKNGKVKKEAFFRLQKDASGVTVVPEPENCTDGLDKPIHGKISLHVGKVRDAGFDIVPDRENHANIIGLPIRTQETLLESTGLAHRLAKLARPYIEPEPAE